MHRSRRTATLRIEPLFSAEVYGARLARALDALAALEACVSADLLRGPEAPETVPFVRPQMEGGTLLLYEADTLTWRFYRTNAGCVVHAINNAAYGDALARALRWAPLFRPSSSGDDDGRRLRRREEEGARRKRRSLR
jgi:hypothetical protein